MIKKYFEYIVFITYNTYKSLFIKGIKEISVNGVMYRVAKKNEFKKINEIYKYFHKGENISILKKFIYKYINSKLILIAVTNENGGENIVGMNMFYFNKRDIADKTIHEGFIGVLPKLNGLGIATNLRLFAIKYFKRNNINGISSRISADNIASLKSAEKINLLPVEKQIDEITNKEIYYLKTNNFN